MKYTNDYAAANAFLLGKNRHRVAPDDCDDADDSTERFDNAFACILPDDATCSGGGPSGKVMWLGDFLRWSL